MHKHVFIASAAAAIMALSSISAQAGVREDAAAKVLNAAVPDNFNFGNITVKKVSISPKNKTVTIDCNDAAAYLPLNNDSYNQLAKSILASLGSQYRNYKIEINSGGKALSDLILFADKNLKGPQGELPFITLIDDGIEAPKGLDNANIALWQSHGWYFEPKLNRWEWQRARIFETVEDLYTQSYVIPYLIPMLENAGAYVMSPRERDCSSYEAIADHDGSMNGGSYSERGHWSNSGTAGFRHAADVLTESMNPFRQGGVRQAKASSNPDKAASACWSFDNAPAGRHAVYVSYVSLPNSATDAIYTIHSANGDHRVKVNQRMGGGTWIYLGHYDIDPAKAANCLVELSGYSAAKNAVVTADAVKLGGGIINVARRTADADGNMMDYVSTDYPRFVGGARYQLQWAGAPDSVYTPSGNENDYSDDYRSRALWVNWLTGGSSMLPGREGLGIPVDLSFAFHSDAGTTMDDEIIGTLGIYSTAGDTLGNGSSSLASRDFTDLVMSNIVNDIRAKYEPAWTRRGMWDKSYFEAREPAVPAMLLELLSHQNFADMKYGLDPRFRFDVSRAIYKGMLQFLAHRDGREYAVQPLAVNSFAISNNGAGNYTLSWKATPDSLESSAMPTYYIVEERVADGSFSRIGRCIEPRFDVKVNDSEIHSYRIIAGNEGGVSFPGETLALCYRPDAPEILVVNGFTRTSAPRWFDSGDIAGFYNAYDSGVPDRYDIGFIGDQVEFRRNIPWMDDDAAGFGASRSNYETRVIAGNTFDYPYIHGRLIAEAGYAFTSSSLAAWVEGSCSSSAKVVDLILGKQRESTIGRGAKSPEFKTFTPDLQARISAATQAGTSMLISGSYVASDLWDNPNSSEAVRKADIDFAKNILGYQWRSGQAAIEGEARTVQNPFGISSGLNLMFNQHPDEVIYSVESPDAVFPADKRGATFMRYSENNLPAGSLFNAGSYRTAIIGFPLEHTLLFNGATDCVDNPYTLVKQILNFLYKK